MRAHVLRALSTSQRLHFSSFLNFFYKEIYLHNNTCTCSLYTYTHLDVKAKRGYNVTTHRPWCRGGCGCGRAVTSARSQCRRHSAPDKTASFLNETKKTYFNNSHYLLHTKITKAAVISLTQTFRGMNSTTHQYYMYNVHKNPFFFDYLKTYSAVLKTPEKADRWWPLARSLCYLVWVH